MCCKALQWSGPLNYLFAFNSDYSLIRCPPATLASLAFFFFFFFLQVRQLRSHCSLFRECSIIPAAGPAPSLPSGLCLGFTFSGKLTLTTPHIPPSPFPCLHSLLYLITYSVITPGFSCLSVLECKFSWGRFFIVLFHVPKCLEQCLVHCQSSLNLIEWMNKWTEEPGLLEHSPRYSLPKGKANGRTTKLWGSIEESNDLFRLEWLSDFSYSLWISLFPESHLLSWFYYLEFRFTQAKRVRELWPGPRWSW